MDAAPLAQQPCLPATERPSQMPQGAPFRRPAQPSSACIRRTQSGSTNKNPLLLCVLPSPASSTFVECSDPDETLHAVAAATCTRLDCHHISTSNAIGPTKNSA